MRFPVYIRTRCPRIRPEQGEAKKKALLQRISSGRLDASKVKSPISMQFVFDRLTRIYGWNRRAFIEDDFDRICDAEGVYVVSLDIDAYGSYSLVNGSPTIIINPRVLPRSRLWVYGHEVGHALLHYGSPCAFTYSSKMKLERQADLVAAVALIPRQLIETETPWEIHDQYRLPIELCEMRLRFFQTLGI